MNPNESSELNVDTLLALRHDSDALQVITEKLRVKEMGPADHIRTKHEVKAFMASGDVNAARELLKAASARRDLRQREAMKMGEQQSPGLAP